ncbi:ABC transporter substrate-binding protein [Deinococcus yavapaiensis]|uniref:Monosaccharide ABC transporter substrate-binding protein (CUT2 family) n=1 Tax=Deinococcus yavapaiensis KR-236 TaxID=694435 RepID=A0A318S7S2_9DEIO|nr:ABC transporter substrate-binding protein [Deinococcus yavapaiensis]PYE54966.1 monosaccharide ABC transporter substrate-binding protein (CUT2 family) [Deinococcus yavapaiensis KR-236]
MSKQFSIGMAALAAITLGMTAAGQSTPLVIGVSIPSATHGWTGGVVYHANEAAKDLAKKYPNARFIIKTANSPSEQANQIQDLYTVNKINTLVILPFESAPLTRPVANLKKQGVYTVVVDRGLTDTSAQDAYVAGDNPGFGKVAAQFMGKQMGGKGNVVILRGLPTVIDNQRVDSFEAAMKTQYPNVKILDKKFGNWNRDDAFKVMQDYLTRYPKIDAVWASDDDMAVGVLKAIQQAKRTDIKFVLGGAGMKDMIKRVMDGDKMIPADVTYPPAMIADAMRLATAARSKGQKMPASTIIPSVLVTKANAKQFYYPNSPF